MLAGCFSLLMGVGVLVSACGGDTASAPAAPQTQAGGSGGADSGIESDAGEASAGSAGAAGTAGAAGSTSEPDRGDPDAFPTECLATCEEACAKLTTCGGADSTFPLTEDECLTRCQYAGTGPGGTPTGGDQNFRCCASQDDCQAVKECGGWLAYPTSVDTCARYCECRLSGAMVSLIAGHQAPDGYRFAPDVLVLEPIANQAKASLPAGVRLQHDGKLKTVKLDATTSSETLAELRASARVLPTFVDASGRISAASGALVLMTDDDAARSAALQAAAQFGLGQPRELRARLRDKPNAKLTILAGADPWRTVDAVRVLSGIPGVRAELDQWRRYVKRYAPNDPLFADQWHLQNVGQNGSTVSVDGRVAEAWDVTMGDPQVVICINDDGVDLGHPEFEGKLEPELNFPADWQAQMAQGQFAQHGTSVAGVAAAKADNAQGGAGVCPNCRLLPHLLGDSSGGSFQLTDAAVAQGFEDVVDAGAWVINNSWGLDMGDPMYVDTPSAVPALSSVVKAAFDYAETSGRGGLGTIVTFAAGNSNTGLDPYVTYSTIIAVSAVDDLGLKPYYSSFGSDVDIAAPSNGGYNGITATAAGSDYTAEFGGTSSASPFISGVFGLVLSANPALTAAEARDIVKSTATKIDPVFGQWDQSGHSQFHGSGLVNAYAAVQLAAGGCAAPESCIAPSDDCGASCGTGQQCALCRTHADCAPGYKCQALPSLGQLTCVAEKGSGDCPAGTNEVNGYCLPARETCGMCGGTEECNGRDDDCNGLVDDGNVCQGGSAMCFIDGPGCGTGMACAGRRCTTVCTADSECGTGATCKAITDQYGAATGEKVCAQSGGSWAGTCAERCEARASGLSDDGLAAFNSCVQDNTDDCQAVMDCRELLTPTPPQDN